MATRSRRTTGGARKTASTKRAKPLDPKGRIQIGAGNLFALHVRRARNAASFAKRDQSIAAQEIVHRLEVYFGQRINPHSRFGYPTEANCYPSLPAASKIHAGPCAPGGIT